MREATINL